MYAYVVNFPACDKSTRKLAKYSSMYQISNNVLLTSVVFLLIDFMVLWRLGFLGWLEPFYSLHYYPFNVASSSSPSFNSLMMSSPPTSSPWTYTCGYVGQLENFLRPCRMSSSDKISKVENSTSVSENVQRSQC